jgi:hypothetical protein
VRVKMFHPELDDEHVIEILPEQVVPHESVGWQVIEDDDTEPDDTSAPAVEAAEDAVSTPSSGGRGRGKRSRTTPPVEAAADTDASSTDDTVGV